MQSDILRFTDTSLIYDEIEKHELRRYERVAGTILNTGEIHIVIEQQDPFSHPSRSYLVLEGRLMRTNGDAHANADAVAIANNGLMYLLSQISYSLTCREFDRVYHPGQAKTMLGLLKYPDSFAKAQSLNQLCSYSR